METADDQPRLLTADTSSIVRSVQAFEQWWTQQSLPARHTFRALPRIIQASIVRQVIQDNIDQLGSRRLVIQRLDSRQHFAHPG
jgi:hypothetical protein